jgi:hypothetical protein
MGESIRRGEAVIVESTAAPFQLVFEDDGDTGYLYLLDLRREPQPIIDALHIYDAQEERGREHDLELLWHAEGGAAVLALDGEAHALADFAELRFMCRTGFPPPGPDSPVTTHEWDQAAFESY